MSHIAKQIDDEAAYVEREIQDDAAQFCGDVLASGRRVVSSAVPAHIAERISDVPMSIAEEREQERQRQRRIIDATDAILEGDVLATWAWQDYAYELVALVHHLRNVGATRREVGDAAVQWLCDTAERQARHEVQSC